MGHFGKLGDIITVNNEPLEKYMKKQTGIEAVRQYSNEVSSINKLVKGKIKEKIQLKYDESPSECNHWGQKEIIRRNIMEKKIAESNTQMESVIECIQKLEGEFSTQDIINSLLINYKIDWPKTKISNIMYIIHNALSGEFENVPNLISKKSKTGQRGNLYIATEEFKNIPKQNLYALIKEIRKNKKDSNYKPEQKTEIVVPQPNQSTTELITTPEINLVELVKQLRPRSIVMQDADGALTIIVM